MRRILVTGGAGFIGSNLVHYLLAEAGIDLGLNIERVVTLDKLTYAGNPASLADLDHEPRHVLVVGDICDSDKIDSLLREHQIDSVMHLAAETHVDRSIDSPENFMTTNVVGSYRLLEAFRNYRSTIPANTVGGVLLHVSTDEVYGSLGKDAPGFSETSIYKPNNPYSASKAASDHMARAYHQTYGVPVITIHSSNNYGPYQFPEKLIPLMIGKILKGEALPVFGNGNQIRDWLYVRDHCRGLAIAMARGKIGETYVIGGRNEIQNGEMIRRLIELVTELAPGRVTKSVEELITYVEDRPGHDLRYALDPTRIETQLGWSPKETFSSGLKKTVQWYLDNPEWLQTGTRCNYSGERLGMLNK